MKKTEHVSQPQVHFEKILQTQIQLAKNFASQFTLRTLCEKFRNLDQPCEHLAKIKRVCKPVL